MNRKFKIGYAVVIILLVIGAVSGCKNKNSGKILTPTEVKLDGSILSWNPVQKAEEYKIKINDKILRLLDLTTEEQKRYTYDLLTDVSYLKEGNNDIAVAAIARGASSEFSNQLVFTYEPYYARKSFVAQIEALGVISLHSKDAIDAAIVAYQLLSETDKSNSITKAAYQILVEKQSTLFTIMLDVLGEISLLSADKIAELREYAKELLVSNDVLLERLNGMENELDLLITAEYEEYFNQAAKISLLAEKQPFAGFLLEKELAAFELIELSEITKERRATSIQEIETTISMIKQQVIAWKETQNTLVEEIKIALEQVPLENISDENFVQYQEAYIVIAEKYAVLSDYVKELLEVQILYTQLLKMETALKTYVVEEMNFLKETNRILKASLLERDYFSIFNAVSEWREYEETLPEAISKFLRSVFEYELFTEYNNEYINILKNNLLEFQQLLVALEWELEDYTVEALENAVLEIYLFQFLDTIEIHEETKELYQIYYKEVEKISFWIQEIKRVTSEETIRYTQILETKEILITLEASQIDEYNQTFYGILEEIDATTTLRQDLLRDVKDHVFQKQAQLETIIEYYVEKFQMDSNLLFLKVQDGFTLVLYQELVDLLEQYTHLAVVVQVRVASKKAELDTLLDDTDKITVFSNTEYYVVYTNETAILYVVTKGFNFGNNPSADYQPKVNGKVMQGGSGFYSFDFMDEVTLTAMFNNEILEVQVGYSESAHTVFGITGFTPGAELTANPVYGATAGASDLYDRKVVQVYRSSDIQGIRFIGAPFATFDYKIDEAIDAKKMIESFKKAGYIYGASISLKMSIVLYNSTNPIQRSYITEQSISTEVIFTPSPLKLLLANQSSIRVDESGRLYYAWEIFNQANFQCVAIDYMLVYVVDEAVKNEEDINETNIVGTFKINFREGDQFAYKDSIIKKMVAADINPDGNYRFVAQLIAFEDSNYENSDYYPITDVWINKGNALKLTVVNRDSVRVGLQGQFGYAWEIFTANSEVSEIEHLRVYAVRPVLESEIDLLETDILGYFSVDFRTGDRELSRNMVAQRLLAANIDPYGEYRFVAQLIAKEGSKYSNSDYYPITGVWNNPRPEIASGETYNIIQKYNTIIRSASSTGQAYLAVDANANTRWESKNEDPQWILLDLFYTYEIEEIAIYWEKARSKEYEIFVYEGELSNLTFDVEDLNWKSVYHYDGNQIVHEDGSTVDREQLDGVYTRYLVIYSIARTTVWGNSIFEIELYTTKH